MLWEYITSTLSVMFCYIVNLHKRITREKLVSKVFADKFYITAILKLKMLSFVNLTEVRFFVTPRHKKKVILKESARNFPQKMHLLVKICQNLPDSYKKNIHSRLYCAYTRPSDIYKKLLEFTNCDPSISIVSLCLSMFFRYVCGN